MKNQNIYVIYTSKLRMIINQQLIVPEDAYLNIATKANTKHTYTQSVL